MNTESRDRAWHAIKTRSLYELRLQESKRVFRGALVISAASILLLLLSAWFLPAQRPWIGYVCVGTLLIPILTPVLRFAIRPSQARVLNEINRRFRLSDAPFAIEEAIQSPERPWHREILQHSAKQIQQVPWNTAWQRDWPKGTWSGMCSYLLLLVCTLILLPRISLPATEPVHPFTQDNLNTLSETLTEWKNQQAIPDELKEQWQQLEEKLAALEQLLDNQELTERDLILELNQLEKTLADLHQQLNAHEAAIWKEEIAHALEQIENFSESSASLKLGELQKAADQLQQAAHNLEQSPEAFSVNSAEQAMANMEALRQSLHERQMQSASEAMGELREATEQRDGRQAARAARELSDAMRQTARKQAFRQSLQQMSEELAQCRSDLFSDSDDSRLAQINSGDNSGTSGQEAGTGAGETGGTGEVEPHEFAHTEQLSGIRDQQGEQESRLVRTEHFNPESTASGTHFDPVEFEQRSREAIEDETIPLVHRQTIRRYFESIRPSNQN